MSFNWEGTIYKLETLNGFRPGKHVVGEDVELLYLPEYPKKIVQKDALKTSAFGVWFVIIMTFVISVVGIILTGEGFLERISQI